MRRCAYYCKKIKAWSPVEIWHAPDVRVRLRGWRFSGKDNEVLDPIAMGAPRFDTAAPEPGNLAYLIERSFFGGF